LCGAVLAQSLIGWKTASPKIAKIGSSVNRDFFIARRRRSGIFIPETVPFEGKLTHRTTAAKLLGVQVNVNDGMGMYLPN
jgi:hypothetical protein